MVIFHNLKFIIHRVINKVGGTLYESEIYEYCIVVRPDIGINEMDNKIISVNF